MNPKVPFKTIFSNDTTNICTCVSPYHEKNMPFKPEMIRETVKEVAGQTDAHFIQLAHGRVPWYQSKVYPMKDHLKWWSEHFGIPEDSPDLIGGQPGYVLAGRGGESKYLLEGGDMLQVFIDACHEFNQAAFVSLRMNDTHHIEWRNTPGNLNGLHSINKFLVENPQYYIRPNAEKSPLDWIFPEVRDTIFELIEEQCENYDLDGFELDFMRFPEFFNITTTTLAQRYAIIGEFITRVRSLLNRTQRGYKYRYLCVRIPGSVDGLYKIGIDVASLSAYGVDMVNVSPSFYTEQQMDIKYFTDRCPDLAVYVEMCHCTMTGKASAVNKQYDNFTFKRTTPNQYYTTAKLAFDEGAQGVSFFNFVYYREHGSEDENRGPFNEPPFYAIGNCNDRDFINNLEAQHYFVAKGWWDVCQLKNMFYPNQRKELHFKMSEPIGGWKHDARLRILVEDTLDGRDFTVLFNGIPLKHTDDISELNEEDNQYRSLQGVKANMTAYTIPHDILRTGTNNVEIILIKGENTKAIRIYIVDVLYK